MESPQNKFDRAFEQKLRQRFEDFQAPEKDALFEKIMQSTGTSRPPVNLTTLSVILLLILGLWAGYHFLARTPEKTNLTGKKEAPTKPASNPALHTPAKRSGNVTLDSASGTIVKTTNYQAVRKVKPAFGKTDASHIQPAGQTRKTETEIPPARVTTVYPDDNKAALLPGKSSAGPEQAFALSRTAPSSLILKAVDLSLLPAPMLHFENAPFPEVAIPGSNPAHEEQYKPKPSKFTPIFGVTGLQHFQFINLHSDSELPFQNVRFAPLFSSRSTGYKISVGMENERLRVLLNYGHLRSWNYYEIGTNRIEVDPTGDGQYVLRRGGIPHVIDERLHLLGISARTPLPLSHTRLWGFATLVGAEYTMTLPDKSSMFWANISATKHFRLGKRLELGIGPFAEYSLTQRKLLEGRWQSRPYRVGLTAELKIPTIQ